MYPAFDPGLAGQYVDISVRHHVKVMVHFTRIRPEDLRILVQFHKAEPIVECQDISIFKEIGPSPELGVFVRPWDGIVGPGLPELTGPAVQDVALHIHDDRGLTVTGSIEIGNTLAMEREAL